jgi:hypothetical protein
LRVRHILNHPRKYFPINEIKIIVASMFPNLNAREIK